VQFAIPLVDRVYVAGAEHGMPGFLLRGFMSAVCLLPPTVLMGASLPAIVRWIKSTPEGVSGGASCMAQTPRAPFSVVCWPASICSGCTTWPGYLCRGGHQPGGGFGQLCPGGTNAGRIERGPIAWFRRQCLKLTRRSRPRMNSD
jgi:hypothetical protein